VKYAYQELPHPVVKASPHSQKVEEKKAWLYGYTTISLKKRINEINESENPRGYRLGTVSGKTLCH
jgi:hypothetical protein